MGGRVHERLEVEPGLARLKQEDRMELHARKGLKKGGILEDGGGGGGSRKGSQWGRTYREIRSTGSVMTAKSQQEKANAN